MAWLSRVSKVEKKIINTSDKNDSRLLNAMTRDFNKPHLEQDISTRDKEKLGKYQS